MMVAVDQNNNKPKVAIDGLMGRPRLPYSDAGSRLKRKIAMDLANIEEYNTSLRVHAASISAKKKKNGRYCLCMKANHFNFNCIH